MACPSLHADGLEMEGMKIKSTWLQNERWQWCAAEETFQEAFLIWLSLSDTFGPGTARRLSHCCIDIRQLSVVLSELGQTELRTSPIFWSEFRCKREYMHLVCRLCGFPINSLVPATILIIFEPTSGWEQNCRLTDLNRGSSHRYFNFGNSKR